MTASVSWRKRTGAFIAAAALGTTMAFGAVAPTPAWAASGTVTITSATEVAQGSTKYNAYRLFTADVSDADGIATRVAWDKGVIPGDVVDFLNGDDNAYDSWLKDEKKVADVTDDERQNAQYAIDYISSMIKASDGQTGEGGYTWVNAGTFAAELASWVATNVTAQTDKAVSGQPYTNEEGYYLFLSDSATIDAQQGVATSPIWFVLGGNTTKIAEKAAAPTIEKKVMEGDGWADWADAELGEAVSFKITAKVPGNYNAFGTFALTIEDVLPDGMTVDEDSIKVQVADEDVTPTTKAVADGKLTVGFDNTKTIAGLNANTPVELTYAAKLDAGFTMGKAANVNSVTMTYSNDPNSATTKGTTTAADAKVFTYGAAINKVDKATDVKLAGAKFVIKNTEGKFLTEEGFTATEQTDAKTFVTNEQGQITGINGLDADDVYTFIEIEAPEGYELPQNKEFTLTLVRTLDGENLDTLKATVAGSGIASSESTDAASGVATIKVTNDKNITLAMTGAEGVGLAGVAVLGLGMAWYLASKRRKGNEQA